MLINLRGTGSGWVGETDARPETNTPQFAEQAYGWGEIYGPDADIVDPQDPAAFEASVLDWDEPTQEAHAAMLAWHRTLIGLRREHFGRGIDAPRHPVSTRHGDDWFALTHGPLTVVAAPRAAAEVSCPGELVARFGQVEHAADGTLRLDSASVAVVRSASGT